MLVLGTSPSAQLRVRDPDVKAAHLGIEAEGDERLRVFSLDGEATFRRRGETLREGLVEPGEKIEVGSLVLRLDSFDAVRALLAGAKEREPLPRRARLHRVARQADARRASASGGGALAPGGGALQARSAPSRRALATKRDMGSPKSHAEIKGTPRIKLRVASHLAEPESARRGQRPMRERERAAATLVSPRAERVERIERARPSVPTSSPSLRSREGSRRPRHAEARSLKGSAATFWGAAIIAMLFVLAGGGIGTYLSDRGTFSEMQAQIAAPLDELASLRAGWLDNSSSSSSAGLVPFERAREFVATYESKAPDIGAQVEALERGEAMLLWFGEEARKSGAVLRRRLDEETRIASALAPLLPQLEPWHEALGAARREVSDEHRAMLALLPLEAELSALDDARARTESTLSSLAAGLEDFRAKTSALERDRQASPLAMGLLRGVAAPHERAIKELETRAAQLSDLVALQEELLSRASESVSGTHAMLETFTLLSESVLPAVEKAHEASRPLRDGLHAIDRAGIGGISLRGLLNEVDVSGQASGAIDIVEELCRLIESSRRELHALDAAVSPAADAMRSFSRSREFGSVVALADAAPRASEAIGKGRGVVERLADSVHALRSATSLLPGPARTHARRIVGQLAQPLDAGVHRLHAAEGGLGELHSAMNDYRRRWEELRT